jgi:hypothetical protein
VSRSSHSLGTPWVTVILLHTAPRAQIALRRVAVWEAPTCGDYPRLSDTPIEAA